MVPPYYKTVNEIRRREPNFTPKVTKSTLSAKGKSRLCALHATKADTCYVDKNRVLVSKRKGAVLVNMCCSVLPIYKLIY